MSRRSHSDQLATLTAHATQLQTRLLVALDTLDSQSLAHASELAALQDAHDRLAARARRLEYERNSANEDLAEMTAVLELVIEKVSAANDYKALAHSNLHLPAPISPPRARSSTSSHRPSSQSHTPTDSSAYTTALVSALTAQLDASRAQAARERADAERKIAKLEAMVELRDVEIRRNLGKSANGTEESVVEASKECIASGSDTGTSARKSSGMSRGEALAAYEGVAKDNERLEKEVVRLRAELAAADFNRATSEVGPSSSWAQIPDWARPQSQSQLQSQDKPTKPKRTRQPQSQAPTRSASSDHAPSSASEPRASNSSFELNPPRTRSSGSTTADPNRSRTPRHMSVFSGSDSERGSAVGVVPRPRPEQNVGTSRPPRRSGLRDSGIGADSGTDTTRVANGLGTKPSSSTKTKNGTRDRRAPEKESTERHQQRQTESTNATSQQDTTASSIQLMPLLPVLTPSKVRAPRVEVIDLPSTSYIEPSFGIHLARRGNGQPTESDSSMLEPPRSAALGPVSSPGIMSPIGELVLPPSVVTCGRAETQGQSSLAAPVSLDSCVLLPSSIGQSTSMLSVETARATSARPSPSPPIPTFTSAPAITSAPTPPPAPPSQTLQSQLPDLLQPAPILQPTPSLFDTPSLLSFNTSQQPQRSRSSSRTARLSPLPVFDLTGLPAYEAVPGTSSAPVTKTSLEEILNDPANPTSPTRRQSDPAPVSAPGSPPLMRERSNSVIPVSQPVRGDSTFDAPPSTPPRSTNNTAQFAFITPVLDRTVITGAAEDPPAPGVGNKTSTGAELGTTIPGSITLGNTSGHTNTTTTTTARNPENATTGRRRLLPLFKFISPSPGTPPSTKKRRSNRAMTAPSQFNASGGGGGGGPASPMGIASSPLARGRVVRESPLQLVMGAAHVGMREGMRIPVMREVGPGTGAGVGAGAGIGGGMVGGIGGVGLVPPLVPTTPLVPLVAQLVPFPGGTSAEAQAAVRGMRAERDLLGRAQQHQPQQEVTPEGMAKVLLIEAECVRLRRDSAEAAKLRQEVEMLRSQLQLRERGGAGGGGGSVQEQGASTPRSYSFSTSSYQTDTP
ncbi:hypothetical protein FRC12_015841 [Ceratobasidium sp. 428]|nr:hypothetical protein FRC12_015841 [Ceratobasidium sp. 428]